LDAAKANGERFRVWLLAKVYPQPSLRPAETYVARYFLQEGDLPPKEFVHRFTGEAVLPSTGAWEFLWPRPESDAFRDGTAAPEVTGLGHTCTLESSSRTTNDFVIPEVRQCSICLCALW
jgi:hypothetical protein